MMGELKHQIDTLKRIFPTWHSIRESFAEKLIREGTTGDPIVDMVLADAAEAYRRHRKPSRAARRA